MLCLPVEGTTLHILLSNHWRRSVWKQYKYKNLLKEKVSHPSHSDRAFIDLKLKIKIVKCQLYRHLTHISFRNFKHLFLGIKVLTLHFRMQQLTYEVH